jgi:hypothetical protein
MRLIDADEALRLFGEEYEETKELIHNGETQLDSLAEGFTEAYHIIKYVVPTVDAVEVVRCRDCIYTRKVYGRLVCKYGTCACCILRDDFFCANGERRDYDKDSGERTKFPSGALRDMHTGKGRMDLLPWSAIMEVSKHCEAGALKYGEHNVDKGIPTHSLLDSAIRHAAKYLAGYVDEPHLVAAAWNLLWAIEMEIVHPECVDTPWRAADGE